MKNMLNFQGFSAQELEDILTLALDMKKDPEKVRLFCERADQAAKEAGLE